MNISVGGNPYAKGGGHGGKAPRAVRKRPAGAGEPAPNMKRPAAAHTDSDSEESEEEEEASGSDEEVAKKPAAANNDGDA